MMVINDMTKILGNSEGLLNFKLGKGGGGGEEEVET